MHLLKHKRATVALAAAVAAAIGLAGCSTSPSSPTSGAEPTINAALAIQFDTLDPIKTNNLEMTYSIYDFLTRLSPKGALTPSLATKWTSNSDDTVWTFTIRKGVTFWDGTALTAKDIAWNFTQTMQDTASPNHIYTTSLKSVVATSSTTVVFTHNTAYAAWPREVSLIPIASQAAYEKEGAAEFGKKPMGSGPYQVVSWNGGDTLTVKAFPKYWAGAANVKNIVFHYIPDETTRLNALRSGSLDVALLNSNQIPDVKSDPSLTDKSIASDRSIHLGFDVNAPGLTDVNVRKAIAEAVDTPAIIKTLYHGLAKPVGQLVAPSTYGYDPAVKPIPYSPSGAEALIKASTYKGETINLYYPTAGVVAEPVQLAQAIAGYLGKVGLKINLVGTDPNNYSGDWFGKKLTGIYLFSFQPSILDAGLIADYGYGPFGPITFSDPAVTTLVLAQHEEANPAKRLADFTKLWTISTEKAYYAPLFNDTYNYVTSNKVTMIPRSEGYMVLQDLSYKK
jgi:peptide/nickel transport system substrate-binding protein